MTNRAKAVKAKSPLRFLDLSFEGRQREDSPDLTAGVKPHSGYRVRCKHPLSHLSFDKNRDYHEKLREDIDKLLEEDELKVHGSPAWVCEANREVSHGGESPLIVNKFLAASRVERPRSTQSQPRSVRSARNSDVPPPKKEGRQYYRPNRTHQYLTSTELKDCSQSESNIKYGRPTRTTLLRARQRSNSAPINAYEVRREMLKRAEERKSKSYLKDKHDVLNICTNFGETHHSWLIGARYNRAHYVDAKSFSLYGMYMPRNNPVGCFVIHSLTNLDDADQFSCPSAPPDTPRSDDEGEITPNYPPRVRSAPIVRKLHLSSSPPTSKQAWGEAAVSSADVGLPKETEPVKQNGDPVLDQGSAKPDGLNLKGSRLFAVRTESPKRPILPTVQGVSWRSPRRREPTQESMTSHPPPTTPMGLASTSQKDLAESVKLEDLITKRSYSSRGPPSDKSPSEQHKDDHRLSAPKKIRPILVDRSVNVPSVSGDSGPISGAKPTGASALSSSAVTDNLQTKTSLENPDSPADTNEKREIGTDLSLEQVDVTADSEAPINSPEGTAHMTSPCSDGNGSQTGNGVYLSRDQTTSTQPQMVVDDETQNMENDNVAFFLTEEGEEKTGDENSVEESEKELENLPDDQTEHTSLEAEMINKTNNAENLDKAEDIDDAITASEKDNGDNDDENNIPSTPVIQVKVDISKRFDS